MLIVAGGRRIYFAGDTAYAPFFSDVRQRLGPIDLALLPIGAYEPRWFMQAVHMNPAEAVQAHLDLGRAREHRHALRHVSADHRGHRRAAARAGAGAPGAQYPDLAFSHDRLRKIGTPAMTERPAAEEIRRSPPSPRSPQRETQGILGDLCVLCG